MLLEACFLLGYLGRPHGLRGELYAMLTAHSVEPYLNLTELWVDGGGAELRHYVVHAFTPVAALQVKIKLAGVDDRTAAEALSGLALYLPLSQLPALQEGQFFYHEIVGFAVQDVELGPLGTVMTVLEMPAQDLVQVLHPSGKEILIPIRDEVVTGLNREQQVLYTCLPSGLVEVFLDG